MKMPVRYILKHSNKLLLSTLDNKLSLPETLPSSLRYKGEEFCVKYNDIKYIGKNVEAISDVEPPFCLDTLKAAYPTLSHDDYRVAGKLLELLHWDTLSQFCGRCGASNARSSEISKKCTVCGNEVFAPVAPAIIVLVRRGNEALLVHARNFSRPNYGLVAGFVETGESLEECVKREVAEETSLTVDNICYVGSQPWPYPNSLMLGFTADYVSGDLKFADGELTAGGFFSPDNLPELPPHPSIARAMIEAWLDHPDKH